MINQLDAWHKTAIGTLFFAGFELGLAYLFGSLAIDRGNLWYYALTMIFLVGTLRNIVACLHQLIQRVTHA